MLPTKVKTGQKSVLGISCFSNFSLMIVGDNKGKTELYGMGSNKKGRVLGDGG